MLLENSLKKYKEAPEAIKQMVCLVGLTTLIIFTFIILNIFFLEIKESDKIAESVNTAEIDKVITSLPRGRLNFYESSEGHQLSPNEYEAVCKNTKIVTQRAMMGANILNFRATKLYYDKGNKIDERSVRWDSSSKKCFAQSLNLFDVVKKDQFIIDIVPLNKLKKIFNSSSHFKNINLIFNRVFK